MAAAYKKNAIQRVVRDASGNSRVILIDAATFLPIKDKDVGDYKVLNQHNSFIEEVGSVEDPDAFEARLTGELALPTDRNSDGNIDEEEIEDVQQNAQTPRIPQSNNQSNAFNNGTGAKRNEASNFGYISEPGWAKAATMLPGPLGMVAKAARMTNRVNNQAAVNVARATMGLPPTTQKENLKAAFKDQKGLVAADFDIAGKKYDVGLEALSPSGKTTLTPQEARQRAALAGVAAPTVSSPTAAPQVSQTSSPAPSKLGQMAGVDAMPGGTPSYNPRADTGFRAPAGFAALRESWGPARPNPPDQRVQDIARAAVAQTFGPGYSVVGISGKEDEGEQHGADRHPTGKAMDMQVVDSKGRAVTDQNKMKDLAMTMSEMGIEGIGYGPGYMGGVSMHVDTVDPADYGPNQDSAWGKLGNAWQSDLGFAKSLPNNYRGSIPTPYSRDEAPPGQVAQAITKEALTTQDQALDALAGKDVTKTPAALAGFMNRTAPDKQAIGVALAGELSPATLAGLAANDPEAMAEAASVMSTIDNRSFSTQNNETGVVGALSQGYDAFNPAAMNTTLGNYSKYAGPIGQVVDSYYAGALAAPNPSVTNYYNASLVSPAWGNVMANPEQVGYHTFGTLAKEFQPGPAYNEVVDRYSTAQINRMTQLSSAITGVPSDLTSGGWASGINAGLSRAGGGIASVGSTRTSSVSGSTSRSAPGTGAFGSARGAGTSQGSAGLGSMGGTRSGQSSFGGFSAGSLGGTSKGLGSGLGAAGKSAGLAGGFSTSNGPQSGGFSGASSSSGKSSSSSKSSGGYMGGGYSNNNSFGGPR